MIPRRIHPVLIERLDQFPAVALLGPRQVGKTTLAQMVAAGRPSLYLDLESEPDRVKLAEPELYLAEHEDKLVILDDAIFPNWVLAFRQKPCAGSGRCSHMDRAEY